MMAEGWGRVGESLILISDLRLVYLYLPVNLITFTRRVSSLCAPVNTGSSGSELDRLDTGGNDSDHEVCRHLPGHTELGRPARGFLHK